MKKTRDEIQKKIGKQNTQLTPAKKRILLLITIILPFGLIVLLELSLRLFNYGEVYPLFVPTPDENSKYYGINLDVAKRYFNTVGTPTPRKDLFLKVKPNNGYRIFVLGESTAAGFPYGNNLTFPRILNRQLSDAFPEKHIEVINMGITAINSYTLNDFMDEILEQKPDAVLIYAGHNEYYGALGVGSMESLGKSRWLVKLMLSLQGYRTYQLVRNTISGIVSIFGESKNVDNTNASATLMERIVNNKIIPYKSDDYELGKKQFKENISEIIERAKTAGVQVIISELVSNIKDNKPFESVKVNGYPEAKVAFEEALKYEEEENYAEAKKSYYLAKDLDALRFRAPEEFNGIVHQVAAKYDIPLIKMKEIFERNSTNKIIGNSLMHEHLHPNIDGYFLMADAFFRKMREEKFISSSWNQENIKNVSYYKSSWGITKLDSMFALLNVKRLKEGWPFVKGKGVNSSLFNYKHTSKADSLAAYIINSGQMTLEEGHIALGQYYEQKGEYELAFKEYNALVYTVPYLSLFYEPAVKILIVSRQYEKALPLLLQWIKYDETAFANQWAGQIYLVQNEREKGIVYLEKAVSIGSNDLNLLYNLSRAYYETEQWEKGDNISKRLKSYTNDPFYTKELDEYRNTLFKDYSRGR